MLHWLARMLRNVRNGGGIEPTGSSAAELVHFGWAAFRHGRFAQALQCATLALEQDARHVDALLLLGNTHAVGGKAEEATEAFRRLIELRPDAAGAHLNLGVMQKATGRIDEAIASLRRAASLDPGSAQASANLGLVLLEHGQAAEAESCLRKAVALDPGDAHAHSNLLLCLNYLENVDAQARFEEHLAWARRHAIQTGTAYPKTAVREGALRIGYVSADFRRHSVGYFMRAVLAAHDPAKVEVLCFANMAHGDDMTDALQRLCKGWKAIQGLSDDEAAQLVRDSAIDVLVDLAGHTGGGRLGLFARKPAPVQVTWLGYPNTTGMSAMDYRLTDELADPAGSERYYSEKLLRLAGGFLSYGPPAESPDVATLPALRSGSVTFGSFNNLAKLSTSIVGLWSRILAEVPASRLLLKAQGLAEQGARRHLLERFAAHGISPDRLTLLGPEGALAAHLGRYGEVDIALDTYPYHGTTTTCEALWMGVPVVTLAGSTHVSRVGVSVLTRAGLPELVANDEREYVEKACELAADLARLAELRATMRSRLRRSALLDVQAFVRVLEAAYRMIGGRSGSA